MIMNGATASGLKIFCFRQYKIFSIVILFLSLLVLSGCGRKKESIEAQDMNTLLLNQRAPDFSLQDEDGILRSLSEFKGKKVVIYFYPKDNTPGCTAQACGLRDAYSVYAQHNIVVLGINYDSVASHKKFKARYNLPFILLTDATKDVARAYGAYQGIRNLLFPSRITILINEDGIAIAVLKDIDVATHAQDILDRFGLT